MSKNRVYFSYALNPETWNDCGQGSFWCPRFIQQPVLWILRKLGFDVYDLNSKFYRAEKGGKGNG
jgi:hypothetical protein